MEIKIIWHNKRVYSLVMFYCFFRLASFRVFPFRVSRLGSLDTLLIKTVDEWDHCLRKAVNFQFPKSFQLFSFILIFPNLINAQELYDKYKLYFINPKIHEITSERNALKLINNTLPLHGFLYKILDYQIFLVN